MARTINPSKLRFALLMELDFEQSDSRLIARVKDSIRQAADADLVATFEGNEDRFADTIRDTFKASGASDDDAKALVRVLAFQGVL